MLEEGDPRAPFCRHLPRAPGKGCKERENEAYFQQGVGNWSSRPRAGAPGQQCLLRRFLSAVQSPGAAVMRLEGGEDLQ